MNNAWEFVKKYSKLFIGLLVLIVGAFLVRPLTRKKDSGITGLQKAEDEIKQRQVDQQKQQTQDVNTKIDDLNQSKPQPATPVSEDKSMDELAEEYKKL